MGGESPALQQGAFIYTGTGRKQPVDAPIEQRRCSDQACAIQRCLARSNHKEVYCKEPIAAWRQCCEQAKLADKREEPHSST